MVNSGSEQSGRKLFYGLFIFPLIIAVGMAVLLCTVVLLTKESETPESLITAIKTGSPSKRWQKAFELSNELNQGRGMLRSSGVMKEVIHILNDREEYAENTRSYMAIALSRFDEPEVIPAIQKTLATETSPDVQLYLIWGLGVKEASNAVKDVLPYLTSENEALRKMAAYVLGVLNNSAAIEPLKIALQDPARDVRWNAAVGLARLGSDSGYQELLKMADRKTLELQPDMRGDSVEEIMISGIKGLSLLSRKDSFPTLEQISKHDESLKVREAAIQALKLFEE